jgi:3-hydroxyisobutyrate dehydrogenase-like beta-hydroxyacid dehydrogenase
MFALRDALKDVRMAVELYRKVGASTPLTRATDDLYERAAMSAGNLDISAISTLYELQPA